MALEFNSHLYPPLGFIFRESDGTKFRAKSWAELHQKINDYRAQRGPVGDVAGDLLRQVCSEQPAVCRDSIPPKPNPVVAHRNNPPPSQHGHNRIFGDVTARVGNWINFMLGRFRRHDIQYVPRGEARNRANICQHCPMQQIIASSCGGCVKAIRDARGAILAGEGPSVEPALHACKVLGEDTSTSVHLVQKPENDPQLPGHCWRRTS